jgi:hypothetical protein
MEMARIVDNGYCHLSPNCFLEGSFVKTTQKWNKMFLSGMFSMVLAFGFMVSGCTTIDSVSKENLGSFQNIIVPAKDFTSLGLVFTETSFDTDANGSRGDVFTYNALLKEAQKLGADTIVNVVIDVKKEGQNTWLKFMGIKKDYGIVTGKETWYGSATAIKYSTSLKNVDTTVVSGTTTTTTKETYIQNPVPSSGGNIAAPVKKVWWNPFTWFKK